MIGSDSPTKVPATSNSDGGPFEAAYQVSCCFGGLMHRLTYCAAAHMSYWPSVTLISSKLSEIPSV